MGSWIPGCLLSGTLKQPTPSRATVARKMPTTPARPGPRRPSPQRPAPRRINPNLHGQMGVKSPNDPLRTANRSAAREKPGSLINFAIITLTEYHLKGIFEDGLGS